MTDAALDEPCPPGVTPVAVAVIERADGAVLIGQRPAGKPYAGWWEFPGGKLETGESVHQALVREIDEELGLRVLASEPWVIRDFVYPHATVRLYFRRVRRFEGEPRSREGQAFVWQHPDAVDVEPLLPATVPVLEWLRLPSLYAISNVAELGAGAFVAALERALAAGLKLLQWREKTLPEADLQSVFDTVLQRCRAAGARLLVNSDHSPALRQVADGVHLTEAALHACAARPADACVAASCHDAASLALAGRLGVDLVVVGPVLPTRSHPGASTLGWDGLASLIRATTVPVYALGGLSPGDLATARAAGAHGVAALRSPWATLAAQR